MIFQKLVSQTQRRQVRRSELQSQKNRAFAPEDAPLFPAYRIYAKASFLYLISRFGNSEERQNT